MSDLRSEVITAISGSYSEDLEQREELINRVVALVEKEREACAKIAEPEFSRPCDCEVCYCDNFGDNRDAAMWDEGTRIAAAIRARREG